MAKKKKRSWEDQKVELAEEVWEPIAPGVERFRLPGNEPVRRIITGRRNGKVGGFYSWKMLAHVAHESDGEEWCARVLDVHPAVTAFFGQPETLRIEVEGQKQPERYTPDFLAFFGEYPVRLEFKWRSELQPPKPQRKDDERGWLIWRKAAKMRRHLRIASDAYHRAGLIWKLVTDDRLAAMADRETVDEIVRNGGRPIEPTDLQKLIARLMRSPDEGAPLSECEDLLATADFPRGDILARVQERVIAIDLQRPIMPSTHIHLIRG